MLLLFLSSLPLAFLLWLMFAYMAKWKDDDRFKAMRRAFRSFNYGNSVSTEAAMEPFDNLEQWMRKIWGRQITLAFLRHRLTNKEGWPWNEEQMRKGSENLAKEAWVTIPGNLSVQPLGGLRHDS